MRAAILLVLALSVAGAFGAKPQEPVTPWAEAHADVTAGLSPLDVRFSARGSFDPDNGGLSCSWDFGDGNTGTGLDVVHTYSSEGVYVAVLTVTDAGGLFDVSSIEVRVGTTDTTPEGSVALGVAIISETAPALAEFEADVLGIVPNGPLT